MAELDNRRFVVDSLLKTKREGMEDLIDAMDEWGFFKAPCSGSYHLACEFGLLHHTRHVMEFGEKIGVALLGGAEYNKIQDSVVISTALHDLGKCGQFGKPNYIPNILSSGEQSKPKPFITNPDLLYVAHEIRSISMAQMYIDLTEEEQFAILYHNGMYSPLKYDLSGKETPLQMIVHWADMWACRVIEK